MTRNLNVSADAADKMFVALCAFIGALVFISTTYDFYLKRRNLPHMCNREHYKRPVKGSCELKQTRSSL